MSSCKLGFFGLLNSKNIICASINLSQVNQTRWIQVKLIFKNKDMRIKTHRSGHWALHQFSFGCIKMGRKCVCCLKTTQSTHLQAVTILTLYVVWCIVCFFFKHKIKQQNYLQSQTRSFFMPLCHSLLLPASETELTVDIVNCTSRDFPTPLHRLSSCLYFSYPADGFNYITSRGGGWLLALSIPRSSLFRSDRKTVLSHECAVEEPQFGTLSRTTHLITF